MPSCKQCNTGFEIADEDRKFYDKISPVIGGKKFAIPEPAMCPPCREQLRLTWKNERNLFKRNCDLCEKETFSIYSSDKPYLIYCKDCWWSDKWEPLDYGQEYDPNRSFFEQFNELLLKVPKFAIHQNNNAENSEYTTSTTRNRNCYLISSAGHNEDCYYGIFMPRNKNCVDCTHVMDSQHLYECVDCDKSYNLAFCHNVKDCSDSKFLYDCHGSRNCFFSYGLRNKQYMFRNKQLSKEEYEKKIAEIDFTSHSVVKKLITEFSEFRKNHTYLYYEGMNNENVVASDHIFNSKNCAYCFDCNNLEDCKFCGWYNDSKDSYDVYAFGYGNEMCYNSLEVGNAHNILMCASSWDSSFNLYYCFSCHTSQDLFGCAALKHNKFCILNKKYSKEDYEKKVSEIIENMQKNGEWGEFFPAQFSHFGYNETMANDFYPMSKEDVLKYGWKWHDTADEPPKADKIIPASRLPDKTSEIPEDVLNWAIECGETGRPFKLISQELKFYREHNLPIPHLHPDERYKQRLELRNTRRVYERKCAKCQSDIQTTYSPDSSEKVYCEDCYLKEVY